MVSLLTTIKKRREQPAVVRNCIIYPFHDKHVESNKRIVLLVIGVNKYVPYQTIDEHSNCKTGSIVCNFLKSE